MALLPITFAPDPIFRSPAARVASVDEEVRRLVADMYDTLYAEEAIGLSAPMVGIAKQVAVVDIREGGERTPITLINPQVTWRSDEMQTHEEASLSFPYISAEVTRPHAIELTYLDEEGKPQSRKFEGFLATVIQHEMDYFEGRTFLDHVSRMKRDMLMKKMQKLMRQDPPHVHGEHCNH